MTAPDGDETRQVTLDGELSGDLAGSFQATVTFTPERSDATKTPEPDGRHEFTGESLSLRSTIHTPAMRYSFTVGEVSDAEGLEDADVYEEIDDGRHHVMGTIGPKGSDTYYVHGKLDDWHAEHVETGDLVPQTKCDVAVAGEPRELHKLLGEDAPRYDDTSPESIGGGEHYSEKVTEADADILVVDDPGAEPLRDALGSASSGDIVFVDGDAEIYSPRKEKRFHLPGGVTLASDRGVDGSDGALLHTDAAYGWGAEGLVSVEGDRARVTGLRIRGPSHDERWVDHTLDHEQGGVNARYNDAARLEVDNCEIWGFAHLVVSGEDGHVHHNHLHRANMKGLGYCTSTGGTEGTVFEFNHCEHWRHVVAASGKGGYEARFNLIDGPCISHAMDQHNPGGTYTDLHHNTMTVAVPITGDPRVPFATFRGENVRKARLWKNWVANDWGARDVPSGFTDEWVTHAENSTGEWGDIEWWDNHFGEDEPDDAGIGCPR